MKHHLYLCVFAFILIVICGKEIFKLHLICFRYLNVYQKYRNLLDNTENQEISVFLKEKHSLEGSTKVIKTFLSF